MAISTNCPSCGAGYNLADDMAGKNVECKGCKNAFVVEPRMNQNMDYAPLVAGGRTVREYPMGEYRAKLMTELEPLLPGLGIRYTHLLYIYCGDDDPINIVAAETNVFAPDQIHCGIFTPEGRQNLGIMESWVDLETFAAEADSLARQSLGIAPADAS